MPLPIIPLPLLGTGVWGKVKERVRERDKLRKQNSEPPKIMEPCETFCIHSQPVSPEILFNQTPALGPKVLNLLSLRYNKTRSCLQNKSVDIIKRRAQEFLFSHFYDT